MALRGHPPKSKKQRTLQQALGLHGLSASSSSCEITNDIGNTSSNQDIGNASTNHEIGNASTNHAIGNTSTNNHAIVNLEQESNAKKKHNRVFLENWKISYPWVYPITDRDGNERLRCRWCTFAKRGNPFARAEGSSSLQKNALQVHDNSREHHEARVMWKEHEKRSVIPMEKHISAMTDDEKERIITVMQTQWYVTKRSLPLKEFNHQCNFQRWLKTPNMPIASVYSSYTSVDAGKEFLRAIKSVYFDMLKKEINGSPFYSIQVDESTDISMHQYMIVYIVFIDKGGNGLVHTKFVDLLPVQNASAEGLHDVLIGFLKQIDMPLCKMVGIATDGASVMAGSRTGLVTRLKSEIPALVSFHCIAHRESLAAGDAFDVFTEFKFIDKVAKKLYKWSARSAKRHAILADAVKDFGLGRNGKLRPLKMHDVRWLSKGEVMVRIIKIMPALLTVMQSEDASLYFSLTNYKVQFLLHLFADVLSELNVLNCKLQEEHPDISSIGSHLRSTIETLQLAFLGSSFGADTKHMEGFLRMSHGQMGVLTFTDASGIIHAHYLHLGPMCEGDASNLHESIDSTVAHLVSISQQYVRGLVQALWNRFKVDFDLFEATKFFSPKDYDNDIVKLDVLSREWLDILCKHFGHGTNAFVNELECKGERRSFITRMRNCFKNKDMLTAWQDCCSHEEWEHSFPWTMKLWRVLLVLPLSSVACERGFSRMNKIKDKFRSKLSLDMLSLMMFVGLNTPHLKHPEEVLWDDCFDAWKSLKNRRAAPVQTT